MKNVVLGMVGASILLASCTSSDSSKTEMKEKAIWKQIPTEIPVTVKKDSVQNYFGSEINDPYAWLEEDNAEETKDWVKEQNKVTNNYLSEIPYREEIKKRYSDLMNYEKVGAPRHVGDYFFISKNDGLQDQSVIYYKLGEAAEWQVFMDPNVRSKEGTVTIELMQASADNSMIAYRYSEAGSDWGQIRVRDIETNTDKEDVIKWVKFSGSSWFENGFYYSGFEAPTEGDELSGENKFHTVYFHEMGTPQSQDKMVYRDTSDPNLYHGVSVTEDKKFLVLYVYQGTDNIDIHFKSTEHLKEEFKPMITGFNSKSDVVDHVNGKFLVRTDVDAPMNKLVAIDPNNTDKLNWSEVLPETENYLSSVSTGGGKMFAQYMINATTQISVMDYDGSNANVIELPGTGSASNLGGKMEETKLFYSFTSFLYPPTIFEYDVATGDSKEYYRPQIDFKPSDYIEKQEWFTSKDGTKVPVFIVHKKGLEMDGQNPTLLYAYGGFNISLTPSFSTSRIILLENNGIYVMANLRGGGEFGEDWHQAGMKMKKQNVFDDFIGAAEYLVEKKYTSPNKLAIEGRSNGGLLIGAVMAQRPDLARVAYPGVGVMDMLKYHEFTIGWGWTPEYGASSDSKEMFEYLYGYSPLHNLKEGTNYPCTMVSTADHDDRVVPAHSFKFAARLQETHKGENPVLIRIEINAGHGAGKPMSKVIDEQADHWAFMFFNMGITEL
ncbi:MAG: prolyl oligopeptidase [Salibacteraceae bacterium]|jgi:prolyl oligopeptidase